MTRDMTARVLETTQEPPGTSWLSTEALVTQFETSLLQKERPPVHQRQGTQQVKISVDI